MKTVTIKHRKPKGTIEYSIYTKEEADSLGLSYVYWKDAQAGQMGITDDDYVGECIRRWESRYKGGRIVFTAVTFPMGTGVVFSTGRLRRLKYLEKQRNDIYYFGNKPDKLNKPGITVKESVVCAKVYVLTMNHMWAYKFVRPWMTDKQCEHWGNAFINTKRGRQMIREEIKLLLEDMGYKDEQVIELLAEALNMARKSKNCTNFNRAVENIVRLKGWDKPTDKTKPNQLTERMNKFLEIVEANEVQAEITAEEPKSETKETE